MSGPTYENPLTYRNCRIWPDWMGPYQGWCWQHVDADPDPEAMENRHGFEPSIADCIREIDDRLDG